MESITALRGPVERVDGKLTLRIPLAAGGQQLLAGARSISQVEGDLLIVNIPDWLAEKIGVSDGSVVVIDNRDGKFNLSPAD
jgi:hypothetical protein